MQLEYIPVVLLYQNPPALKAPNTQTTNHNSKKQTPPTNQHNNQSQDPKPNPPAPRLKHPQPANQLTSQPQDRTSPITSLGQPATHARTHHSRPPRTHTKPKHHSGPEAAQKAGRTPARPQPRPCSGPTSAAQKRRNIGGPTSLASVWRKLVRMSRFRWGRM